MLIRDIQIFIGFANFYWRFIQNFSKIALSFIFLLKITESLDSFSKTFKIDDDEIVNRSNSRIYEIIVNLSKNNKFRKSMHMPNIGAIGESNFLTLNAKKTFNYL